jgi:hypothetical protein
MLTVRAALGGPWAGNFLGWLLLLVPTTVVVFLQETDTGYSSWLVIAASAIAQHVASAIVVFGIIAPARLRWPVIPLAINIVAWVCLGIVRGVIAAAFAASFGAGDPGWIQRPLVWVAISCVWMPLITYALAQLDYRRILLGQLARETERLRVEDSRSQRTAEEMQSELITAISKTIGPVISEVRKSLESLASELNPRAVASIGKRLTAVAHETAKMVSIQSLPTPVVSPPPRRAPISAAVDFDQDRPFYAAFLAGVALLPFIVPDTLRVDGIVAAWQAALAVGVTAIALGLSLRTLRWWRRRSTPREWTVTAYFLVPGVLGSITLGVLWGPHLSMHGLLLEILFPLGTVFAGATLSIAVGLTFANAALDERVRELTATVNTLAAQSLAMEERAQEQVANLLHGPIHGRLSACAMALNFYSAELRQGGTERSEYIMETVRDYLEAASRDLELLTIT